MGTDGAVLFARYAYAPNDLGYCGPAESAALLELGATGRTGADIVDIARRFSGAWPYAVLLAKAAGIDDPLDEQVMRAYWTGSALLGEIDSTAFGTALLEQISATAGSYWGHLTAELLPEVAPTHGFHVFGVYPWSRLLGELPEQALRVLDNCRIRWGEVAEVEASHVLVRSRRLAWDGHQLSLADAQPERVRYDYGDARFVDAPRPGDLLALHWDTVCERITSVQHAYLEQSTTAQLVLTNRRIARDEVAL